MKQQLNIRASDLTTKQLDELGAWWGTSQTETFSIVVDRIYQAEQAKRQRFVLEEILAGKVQPEAALTDGQIFYYRNDNEPLVSIGRMPGNNGIHILRRLNGILTAIGGYNLRQGYEAEWFDVLAEDQRAMPEAEA